MHQFICDLILFEVSGDFTLVGIYPAWSHRLYVGSSPDYWMTLKNSVDHAVAEYVSAHDRLLMRREMS